MSLTGPDGLLKQMTKTVLETALNQEMTDTSVMTSTARPVMRRGMYVTGPGPRRC